MEKRVLLGMSGGTDSSVAAMKLQEAGYEVTGVTLRLHDDGGRGAEEASRKNIWRAARPYPVPCATIG